MTSHSGLDAEKTASFEGLIRSILTEELPDIFNFDPIVVEGRTDHDGDRYLHAYIVFDGDNDKLEPAWTMTLPEKLWNLSMEMGYPGIPINSFIPRSEWKCLQKELGEGP